MDGAQKWTGTAYIISILGLATGRGMTPVYVTYCRRRLTSVVAEFDGCMEERESTIYLCFRKRTGTGNIKSEERKYVIVERKGWAKALRTSRRRQEPCERVSVRGAIGREGPLSGKGGWVLSNAK